MGNFYLAAIASSIQGFLFGGTERARGDNGFWQGAAVRECPDAG